MVFGKQLYALGDTGVAGGDKARVALMGRTERFAIFHIVERADQIIIHLLNGLMGAAVCPDDRIEPFSRIDESQIGRTKIETFREEIMARPPLPMGINNDRICCVEAFGILDKRGRRETIGIARCMKIDRIVGWEKSLENSNPKAGVARCEKDPLLAPLFTKHIERK